MKYTKELLSKVAASSNSTSEVCRKLLGHSRVHGGFHQYIASRMKQYGIDTSHFVGIGWSKGKRGVSRNRISKQEFINIYLIKDAPYIPTVRLKNYCIRFGILEYRCVECNNVGVWNDKNLTLQIDHINGARNDNRASNLRLLCPNCHSQTATFAGKNKYGE